MQKHVRDRFSLRAGWSPQEGKTPWRWLLWFSPRPLLSLLLLFMCAPVPALWAAAPICPGSWTQVATTGPSARYGHVMAYDSVRQKVVLFGGASPTDNRLGDTWEWDGTTWSQVASGGPSPRVYSAMVYDLLHQETILFGGTDAPFSDVADTWTWNGTAWQQHFPATAPSKRNNMNMAYDSVRQVVVMFGGGMHGEARNDTWEWNGAVWTQRTPTAAPAVRVEHAMAYDQARQETLLFGGNNSGVTGVPLGDTWTYDGVNWTQVATSGPSPRIQTAAAYDDARDRVVLFGGFDGSVDKPDTWEWDGNTWTLVAQSEPSPRGATALAYDSRRGKVVLFGGLANAGPQFFGDTWEWTGPQECSPPSVGGSVTGMSPRRVVCTNLTTGQMVSIRHNAEPWDCENLGLVVHPGDRIQQTVTGPAD